MADPAPAEAPAEEPIVDAQVVPDDSPDAGSPAQPAAGVMPGHELAHRPVPGGSTELIVAANAREKVEIAKEIATALDDVIKQQGLRTKIGRRRKTKPDGSDEWVDAFHINVEGWQTLGTLLGLAVVPLEPHPVIDPETGKTRITEYEIERFIYPKGTKKNAIKNGSADVERVDKATIRGYDWRCRTEVYKDGTLISAATAIVSRAEESWRDRDEHALASMAQTRSIGKAIAGASRWIVTLAGYQATPAEEMPADAGAQGDGNGEAATNETPHGKKLTRKDDEERARAALAFLVSDDLDDMTPAQELAGVVWDEIVKQHGYMPVPAGFAIVTAARTLHKARKAREEDQS